MKKPNLIALPVLVLLLIFVSACQKTSVPKPTVAPLGPVKMVMTNGTDPYYSFTYNSNDQLTFFKYRADLKLTDEIYTYTGNRLSTITIGAQKTTFIYNSTGQVTSTETYNYGDFHNNLSVKFTYNAAGKITIVDTYQTVATDNDFVYTFSYILEYNNQGLLSRISIQDKRNNVETGEFQFRGYSNTDIPFNPIIIDKVISGFKLFNSVLFSQFTKLPTMIHYQEKNGKLYEYDDTYEYTMNRNAIDNIKRTIAVTNSGGSSSYTYLPLVFKY
jgi:hypothetical protein